MVELLPDKLKTLWADGLARGIAVEQLMAEQDRLIGEYAQVWADALMLPGELHLPDSLFREMRQLIPSDDREMTRRWTASDDDTAKEWRSRHVDPSDRCAVEAFYDQSQAYVFELMQWHSLTQDSGPLAYVVAMRLAEKHGCHQYLDFGSGVGSGPILFAQHGFDVTLADISSTLLEFARLRLDLRNISARWIDLKCDRLPTQQYDIVTAMDVWEHLVDPVGTAVEVARALKPGGILLGRFAAEPDITVPQHIVFDFQPTFRQFERDGLVPIWSDEWLWGHQAFQKRLSY